MGKEMLIFGNIRFHKGKFHYHKKPTFIIHDADVNKRLISNKSPFIKRIVYTFFLKKMRFVKSSHCKV